MHKRIISEKIKKDIVEGRKILLEAAERLEEGF